jgi:two-component system chemotaxis response regulator CheB
MMVTRQLIRVLVIDDSAFSRQTITRMLQTSPLVEVVGSARDGEEALRKTIELKPDLVTLDLEMPRMDGFTFLRLIMAKRPATPELQTIQQELIRKVHAIRELRIDKVQDRIKTAPPVLCRSRSPLASVPPVVVVGSSTGGPAALMQTFGAFTEAPPCAFLVAQHMPQGFTRGFAERLDRLTPFHVKEAEGGEEPTRGSVLVAPGGYHLELEAVRGRILSRITRQTAADKYTPSVDKLFESAAKHFGSDLLAVVLTGMGDDGRRGACTVKECGGTVIAESEETAVIYGMPQQAVRSGAVDLVLPLNEIPPALLSGVADDQKQERRSRGSG